MTRHSPPQAPSGPEPSNRDKMKDAVQQLLQQKAEEQATTRADVAITKERSQRRARTRYLQAFALLVLLVIAVVFAIPQWRHPFAPPGGAQAEHDARQALVFAANLVDNYEHQTGRLPGNFSQLGVSLPGIAYLRTADSWVLSIRANGRDFAIQKGDDKAAFLAGR